MYTNVKVILNENIDQLYDLCRKSFLKLTIAFVSLWAITALGILISEKNNLDSEMWIIMSMLPTLIVTVLYVENANGLGAIFYAPTKRSSMDDLLRYAQRFSSIPKTIQLSAKIANSNLTIQQICVNDCKEIICTNRGGKTEVIELDKPFRSEFKLRERAGLSSEEIILDLSGDDLVAYVARNSHF